MLTCCSNSTIVKLVSDVFLYEAQGLQKNFLGRHKTNLGPIDMLSYFCDIKKLRLINLHEASTSAHLLII